MKSVQFQFKQILHRHKMSLTHFMLKQTLQQLKCITRVIGLNNSNANQTWY